MNRKKWAALTLSLLGLSIGGTVALVAAVDPFEVYHRATAFIPPISNGTQIYSNAGIAKNYAYDSVVIGSSMTENFRPSQLDRLFGGQFVKLCVNAGSSFNHKQMMDMAFATHDVRRVLYGVDVEALTYFYKTPKCEMPDYLYDDDLFNDVSYWFNKSVLLTYIPECLATLGQSDPDQLDTMYSWGDLYAYGREAVLADVSFSRDTVEQINAEAGLSQQTKLNVEHNFLPFVEQHPDTQFIFFFPPYSAAEWATMQSKGTLEAMLALRGLCYDALSGYDNVTIYDFSAREDWVLDLNNYKDTLHYGQWINDAMAECIAGGEYTVSSRETLDAATEKLRAWANAQIEAGGWIF